MKKAVCMCLAAILAFGMFTACGSKADAPTGAATGKIVVNIEGVVTAVDGETLTLDSGKQVHITSNTIFMGDPDTGNTVSDNISVGNFIQGYTADDPDADTITASKIYCNSSVRTGSKLLINFEGTVASAEDGNIVMEDGQVISVSDDTVFSIASGVVENVILSEGYVIQGYAETDAPASRIHIITY